MDCNSNHSIFLRANGSLACWCDYGSLKILQPFDWDIDYGRDVYLGSVFQYIRSKLRENEMPFPEFCSKCLVLANNLEYSSYYIDRKEIVQVMVEPSILCSLECPGCMTKSERTTRISPPFILEMDRFAKIIEDFKNNGIIVNTFDFEG
ncbi:hypothetical protein JXO59_14265, partial [candidate division KSB1 bacterium]|nr:hypothetical protein [candidate division KSB1 bacterium]